jgi:hypothetical protein
MAADKSWMSYRMPFGKHKSETLGMVRIRDLSWIVWMSKQDPQNYIGEVVKGKCLECIAYINETNPGELGK